MLPKKLRLDLRGNNFFDQRLKKLSGVYFDVLYKKSLESSFAVIISSKHQKKASLRNYFKRVIKDEVFNFYKVRKPLEGKQAVFICKKPLNKSNSKLVREDIMRLMTQLFS